MDVNDRNELNAGKYTFFFHNTGIIRDKEIFVTIVKYNNYTK